MLNCNKMHGIKVIYNQLTVVKKSRDHTKESSGKKKHKRKNYPPALMRRALVPDRGFFLRNMCQL